MSWKVGIYYINGALLILNLAPLCDPQQKNLQINPLKMPLRTFYFV